MSTAAAPTTATAMSAGARSAWTLGPAVSAGGGRGLGPAVREPLRVIAHIDMDAFYAQIEQLRDAALTGRPVAVVQYPTSKHDIEDMGPDDNRVVTDSASSIIAVSYEARSFGVKRNMKAVDAQKACPELTLVQVPTRNGKADISLYRHAGEKVVSVLELAGGALTAVEKASIDEVYVDVTRAAHALLSSLEDVGNHKRQPQRKPQQQQVQQEQQEQHEQHEKQQQEEQQQQQQQQPEQPPEGKEDKAENVGGSSLSLPPPPEDEEGATTESQQRWEDIAEGGWAAVVSEAATTHVAGLPSDNDESNATPTKEQQLAAGASWWARPEGAFTEDEALLVCGSAVVSRLRAAVRSELSYSCTAGVAHNKLLAKLCSNMHKPNAQTVLPLDKVGGVFHTLPVERVRGWGGKLGVKIMERLGVTTAGEVAAVGAAELQRVLGDEEGWRAWEKSNGVDRDPVKARSAPKSIGCSKTFPGKAKLKSLSEIERWLSELSKELVLRLTEQQQQSEGKVPRKLTVSFAEILKQVPVLAMLGVSASGFADAPKDTPSIQSFFGASSSSSPSSSVAAAAAAASGNSSNSDKVGAGAGAGAGAGERSSRGFSFSPASVSRSSSSATAAAAAAAAAVFPPRAKEGAVIAGRGRGMGAAAAAALIRGGGQQQQCRRDATARDGGAGFCCDDGRGDSGGGGGGGEREERGPELEDVCDGDDDVDDVVDLCEDEAARETGGEVQGEREDAHLPGGAGRRGTGAGPAEVLAGGKRTSDRAAAGSTAVDVDVDVDVNVDVEVWSAAAADVGGREDQGFSSSGRNVRAKPDASKSERHHHHHHHHHPRGALFGRGGASGVFGEVDPEVLAELPPEIQREIWMQQGAAASKQQQLRFAGGAKPWRPSGGSASITGGGHVRGGGGGAQKQRRGGRGGRGGRQRGGGGGGGGGSGAAQSRPGSGSISSFFLGK
ncbi:unnamed protein product [Pylaiella littoralis]